MPVPPSMSELHLMGFEAYGVSIAIGVRNRELLPRIQEVLPPGWRNHDPEDAGEYFAVVADAAGTYQILFTNGFVSGSSDLDVALDVLDTSIRSHIAQHAPAHIFVHAGVVAHRGHAVLIPGMTFSGKTTLVAELVRAGATYYSDEYAALDEDGLVHPY